MSRAALSKSKNVIITVLVVVLGLGAGVWAIEANTPSHKVNIAYGTSHQLTQISYRGQNGVAALALLERHAQVQVKHYSFGDMVESINGSKGDGPKYWLYYVNGKESDAGAGTFITHNSDEITWKLQL